MKKLFLLIMLGINAVHAYDITVFNRTKRDLDVAVTYGGKGVCSGQRFLVPAKRKYTYNGQSGCCFTTIRVLQTDLGKEYKFPVPGKIFGMRCKGVKVRVKENRDRSLTLEQA